MSAASVGAIIVGTDSDMSEQAIALANEYDFLWATVGIHPTDNQREQFDEAKYLALASHEKVVAIGECGLDYYWPAHDGWVAGEEQEKTRQKELFSQHIALAERLHKPLMIHGRPTKGSMDAYEDMLDVLTSHAVSGNVHFFVGNTDIAKRFLDSGFTLSFTGVLTFTHDYDDIARSVPLNRVLVETDAPYVAPVPHRGTRNSPLYVRYTYEALARIKGISTAECVAQVIQNADTLFQLRLS